MSATRYLPAAQTAARTIPDVLAGRGLDPLISRYLLVETRRGLAWLFVVLDAPRLSRMEAYISADTLHHLRTALRGRPVLVSNSNGLRYAVLLSRPPQLPKAADCPPWRAGLLQIGEGVEGAITARWDGIGHILAGGMTGSGKSNFLRLLVSQAIVEGHALALADPDGRTFPQLAGHPNLIAPLGSTLDGCHTAITAALDEITRRSERYNQAPGYPDTLEAYNAAPGVGGGNMPTCRPGPTLPRLLVVIDEYNGLSLASGGPRGALAQAATQIAWRGRKFGVSLVLAGQDFAKEIVGPVRDQMTTRVCFRVSTAATSRVVLGRSGAERLRAPGRAWCEPWGLVQTYRAELTPAPAGDGLSADERRLAERMQVEYSGRMTLGALLEIGYPEREARRLRRDWQARGLAVVIAEEDNALCINTSRFPRPDAQTVQTVQTVQAG